MPTWKTGAMIELSTMTMAPLACAMALMARMSTICMRGLVGDSSITSFVLSVMAARTASRSQQSTFTTSTLFRGTTCGSDTVVQ